jgi:hypothetical protein
LRHSATQSYLFLVNYPEWASPTLCPYHPTFALNILDLIGARHRRKILRLVTHLFAPKHTRSLYTSIIREASIRNQVSIGRDLTSSDMMTGAGSLNDSDEDVLPLCNR